MSEAADQLSREERRRRVQRLREHRRETGGAPPALAAIPRRGAGPYPLSFAQQRLWFLDQLEPGLVAYNISSTLRLDGRLDAGALARSLDEIVRRHESLRTTFALVEGTPMQRVGPPGPADLPVVDLSALPEAVREAAALRLVAADVRRPFDLTRGPLLRMVLLRLAADDWMASFAMHHIISDGWSLGLFVRELVELYAGFANGRRPSLPELPIQYGDFAAWQRQQISGKVLEEQLAYWRRRLAGPLPSLNLPTDHPYPAVRTYRGAHRGLGFPAALSERLRGLGRSRGATLFMTLLAAVATLLHRYTGEEDLLLGSPVTDRNRVETEGLIGFFVNTVVLRINLAGDPPFPELLERVRETALGAYTHQDLPFERLVEELQPDRGSNRSPLFQVLLALENAPTSATLDLPGITLKPVPAEIGSARVDLGLELTDTAHGLAGVLEYSTELFEAPTVGRLLDHLRSLLEGTAAEPDRPLSALPLLGFAERHQVLVEWNDTRVTGPAPESVVERFAAQARSTPEATALLWGPGNGLTYRELDRAANGLAHRLVAAGVRAGSRVALLAGRSPGLVVGLLGIWKAGGAYVPLDPSYPAERLRFLLEDSEASVRVAEPSLLDRLPVSPAATVLLDLREEGSDRSPGYRPEPGDLAYMIYTSGTTGTPKAVLVEHGSLAHTLQTARETFGFGPADRMPCLAPFSFDIFLFELLGPLLAGGTSVLFDLRPAPDLSRLAEELEESTLLHAVPALMRQIVDTVREAGRPSRLRGIFVGGDAVPPELLADLGRTFPHARTWVLYGPTEATIICASRAAGLRDERAWIGRPLAGAILRLLDAHGAPVPIGVPGEIWIGGPGVVRGYWNREELTAQRFVTLSGERFFRTGDLARALPGGDLVFLGRADHQVKVRGFRVELGEIEAALALHPEVAQAVVLAREDVPGDRRLVAYVVARNGSQETLEPRLRAALAERLPEWMVPAFFVLLDALPLSAHGKVDRKALPAPDAARTQGAYTAPEGPVEETLAGIWAGLLGVERVGAHDDFFALGGHSLLATQVVSRVRAALGVELPLRLLFDRPTVAGVAAEVARLVAPGRQAPPVTPVPREGELLLSFAQERLFFLDRLQPGSTAYNIPTALGLAGRLDRRALAASLGRIAARHESLRTTFAAVDGRPVQRIAPPAGPESFALPLADLRGLPQDLRRAEEARLVREETRRPFDLARGPLLRAALLRLEDERHTALLTLHHIVSDGWSTGVLVRELSAAYTALRAGREPALPALPVQYADFAVWQRRWLSGEVLHEQLAWWRRHLAGAPALLELPLDRPRPPVQSFRGGSLPAQIPAGLSRGLSGLARSQGGTLFMVLLAAFQALLSRLSGQDEAVIGTPVANRTRQETEGLIGFFVNTLALRGRTGEGTFAGLLARARETLLGAYAHQDLPFEKLVDELQPVRSLSHAPLFQAMLVLQNTPAEPLALPGLALEPVAAPPGSAKLDLTLFLTETPDGLIATWEHAADLFDTTTVARFARAFETLLAAAAAQPDRPLAELPLLSAEERHQLLVAGNDTGEPPAALPSVHERIAAQAARTPEALAVVCGGAELTFGELAHRARRIARALRKRGVGRGDRVALSLKRTPDLVAAVLGILAAGAAYVPIDPAYPEERRAFLLEDCTPRLLLTVETLEALESGPSTLLPDGPGPEDLAYVIYTSGSTGRPKGVMVSHRALSSYVDWAMAAYLKGGAGTLLHTSISFDLTVTSLFVPLAAGQRVILVPETTGVEALGEALRGSSDLSFLKLTPSHARLLGHQLSAAEAAGRTRGLVVGGEALHGEDLALFREASPETVVFNEYGPTEATVGCALHAVRAGDLASGPVPIGGPIRGARFYLRDRGGEPVPAGVPGELWIGGAGLARGYLGRPDLTAERFRPDPFGEGAGERLYRTGDLARRRPDGTLDFLGRTDHQVKVRGFRIELGEIEAALAACPEVREAAVLARETARGEKQLVAYVVAQGEGLDVSGLREALSRRLPEPMVPASFVVLEALPLGPHGKVDRQALPAPERPRRAGGDEAPGSPAERQLAAIWAELLRVGEVGLHDNFFALGGDSILSLQVVARAAREGLRITPRQIFEHQTVAALAAVAGTTAGPETDQGPVVGPVPLTPIQRWFLESGPVSPHHYNQVVLLAVRPPLNPEVAGRALAAVLVHHDALRLRFDREDGIWRARSEAPEGTVPWLHLDLSALPSGRAALEQAAGQVQESLDLAAGPLLRGVWIDLPADGSRLLVTVHHLAVDGVSWRLLLEDLTLAGRQLLAGEVVRLPPKTTSLKEWAERLEKHARSLGAAEIAGWRRESEAPATALPVDHPGGENTEASARHVSASLDPEETRALLQDVPAAYRTQINDVLLTALARSLAGPEGAVRVELEGHGREELSADLNLSRTVGWLTSLYPVRLPAGPAGDPVSALQAVKEHLRAVPGRGLGYGLLRFLRDDEETAPLRSLEAPAVSFNYLGQLDQALPESPLFAPAAEGSGALRSPRHRRSHPLAVGGFVAGGQLYMSWEYSEALHERARVEAWAASFMAALRELIALGRAAAGQRTARYTPSDFPLAGLGPEEPDRLLGTEWGIEDVYPLSPLQEGLLFHSLLEPGSGVYVEQLLVPLAGALDEAALKSACRRLVERHPILRTSFHAPDRERPLQVVHGEVEAPLETEDWRDVPPEELEPRLDGLLRADRERGFDPARAPLLRFRLLHLGDGTHRLLWSHHHLLLDGWSSSTLASEIFDLYAALCRGEEPVLRRRRPFRDYIAWLERQDLGRAEEYWRRVLAGWSEPTPLPGSPESRPGVHGTDARDLRFPADETERLHALARRCRVTLNTLVQAAWGLFLGRASGRREAVFGVTVSGRPPELSGVESMVGLFINTLPVRLEVEEGEVGPWLERIQAEQAELRQFEHSPLVKVRDWSGVRRGTPLFESILVFENYFREASQEAAGAPSAGAAEVRTAAQTNYPLTVVAMPGDELVLRIAYDASRFEAGTVDRMLNHLQTLLGHLAGDPAGSLAGVSLVTAAERLQILGEWNDTRQDWPPPKALHELFEEAAARQPHAPALLFEGETVAYGELAARANRLARLLLRLGVGPETLVGLGFERSPDAIAAMLGVLKAGGAYVPLDPESPRDRLAAIVADAGISILLTHGRAAAAVSGLAEQTVAIDDPAAGLDAESAEPPRLAVPADGAAYAIYTSGSTGVPKGVVTTHRGVVNFVRGLAAALGLGPADRLFLFAPLSFDASVLQIFPPLASGASLAIHRNPRELSGADIVELCGRSGVTVLDLPAALWRQWVEEVAAERIPLPESLRTFLTGGEKVPADKLRTWAGLTHRPISFLSSYGPTEATVTATVFQIGNDGMALASAVVPIGRPLPNVRAYSLDAQMRPLPWGVPGELYLGGEGLARGYLGRPDWTAQSFVPDPLSGEPGARLYRTGDLASHRPDGHLEFLGRTDQQVKLRGFRLEPGEIEAALRRHPAVREAVVLLREDHPGDPRLAAYVLPQEGEAADPAALRAHLSGLLPAPMVPSAFVVLDELPVLASGKLDRAALPAPAGGGAAEGFVAPRDPLEQILAEVWAQVLKVERVGAFDNFFELGGHSLLATQILARLRQTFEIDFELRSLFEEPTVAGLAAALRSSPDADKVEKTAALRIALAGLSDEEVEALLLAEAAAEKGFQP